MLVSRSGQAAPDPGRTGGGGGGNGGTRSGCGWIGSGSGICSLQHRRPNGNVIDIFVAAPVKGVRMVRRSSVDAPRNFAGGCPTNARLSTVIVGRGHAWMATSPPEGGRWNRRFGSFCGWGGPVRAAPSTFGSGGGSERRHERVHPGEQAVGVRVPGPHVHRDEIGVPEPER